MIVRSIAVSWMEKMREIALKAEPVDPKVLAGHQFFGPEQLFDKTDIYDTSALLREVQIGHLVDDHDEWVKIPTDTSRNLNTAKGGNPFGEYFAILQLGADQAMASALRERDLPGSIAPPGRWKFYIHQNEYLVSEFRILGSNVGIRVTDRHFLKGSNHTAEFSRMKDWFALMMHRQQMDRLVFG